jgi:8-oxo-dGTP diphosphatase
VVLPVGFQFGGATVDTKPKAPYPALGVAAKGIVRRDDGAVLIIRRSPHSGTDPGSWDLPGGKMAYGERLVDALVREVHEETGLTVTSARPFHVSHFVKEPFWVTCVTFECSGFKGQVRLSDEHVEHAWVSLGEFDGRPYARAIREQLAAFAALSAAGDARGG